MSNQHAFNLTSPPARGTDGALKMQVAVEKLSSVLLEFAIEVEAERVSSELSRAYRELGKSAKIRGFRPGKAPRQILVKMFGPRVTRDVAQKLVEQTYDEALKGQEVQAVSQPSIESDPVKENSAFNYKARVEIVPEIPEITNEGFEVERPSVEVTKEVLDKELQVLRRANSTLEPPKGKGGAKEGDVVTIDFDVVAGGEVVEDAGAKAFDAEIGNGQLIPEIEKALEGKTTGATADAEVQLPDTHPHPKLKGQLATFKLTIKEHKERILPALDDEFAKDLGDYETLEELSKAVSEDIEKRLKDASDNGLAEALVAELVKANPIEVPQALVQQQNRVTEQEMLNQARARGQNAQQLPQELRATIHADSEVKVRAGLLMAEIAKREGLKIGDPELEEGLKELAEQSGKNIAKLRAEYRDARKREMLVGMILENKVLDIIESKAKIDGKAKTAEDS